MTSEADSSARVSKNHTIDTLSREVNDSLTEINLYIEIIPHDDELDHMERIKMNLHLESAITCLEQLKADLDELRDDAQASSKASSILANTKSVLGGHLGFDHPVCKGIAQVISDIASNPLVATVMSTHNRH
jgi:hypothetical protein